MAGKPENNFIRSVHNKFRKSVYHEKMANPYRGGTADVWYSGQATDLWAEYKFLPTIPTRTKEIRPDCSQLQLHWLRNRYLEGRNVAVIVGTPEGGVIFTDREWEQGISPAEFRSRLKTKAEIAEWIASKVGYVPEHPAYSV